MGYAPKEIREVGIDDFPVPAKQQFFHCDRRLLGIPSRPVGILFGWKIGFKACPGAGQRPDPGDRFQDQRCRRHADPIPHARDAQRPEFAVGLRYKHSSDWLWPISLLPEGKRQFRQPSLDRRAVPSPITTSIWPPERKMAYWRRGALCQSLKRPLDERVKVTLLAACSIDLSMSGGSKSRSSK